MVTMDKIFQKLVNVKGINCSNTPWKKSDCEDIESNGLLCGVSSGLIVVVPALPWVLCERIDVLMNGIVVQMNVAIQAESMGLCVLALSDYNTVAPDQVRSPVPYMRKQKTAKCPGNRILNYRGKNNHCEYEGRSNSAIVRDIYQGHANVGDCVFFKRSLIGIVSEVREFLTVIPKEYIDRIIQDFEHKITGLASTGLEYDTSCESVFLKPQVITVMNGYDVIHGTVTEINGFPINVCDLGIATVYDDQNDIHLPLDLWFQINHRPNQICSITVDGKDIIFKAVEQKGLVDGIVYIDTVYPDPSQYYRMIGSYVATMPFKSLLMSNIINGLNVTLNSKGDEDKVVYLIDSIGDNDIGIGLNETFVAHQLVKIDNKFIIDLDQVTDDASTIRCYNGNEFIQVSI